MHFFFPHLEDISARYLHFHSSAAHLRALVVPFLSPWPRGRSIAFLALALHSCEWGVSQFRVLIQERLKSMLSNLWVIACIV